MTLGTGLVGSKGEKGSPPAEEPAEIADLIRRIAANLDVDNLKEDDLKALSDAALQLASLAKAQSARKDEVASLRRQIDDWEARHSEVVAGVEVVNSALAALRERIDQGQMDGWDVGTCLDLAKRCILVDTRYRTTQKDLERAVGEADFESTRALNDNLESLAAERSQADAALHEATARPSPDDSTPDPPDGDGDKSSETEAVEGVDGLDEVKPPTVQPEPSTVDINEGAAESTPAQSVGSRDKGAGKEQVPEPDNQIPVSGGQPSSPPEGDPVRLDDDKNRPVRKAEDAISKSIEMDRIGLAYHMSLAVPEAFPSPNAIKLAAYSRVTEQRAPVTAELTELGVTLLEEAETVADTAQSWQSHVLFTTCAALEPALAAPGGPVAQLLAFLEPLLGDTPSLRELAKTASDVSMTGVHLPVDLLRGEHSRDKWYARRSALRNETEAWITNERQSTLKFQAATNVWRKILEKWDRGNGQCSIGHMFSLVLDESMNVDSNGVTRMAEYWRANVDKEIDRIDRDNRSWKQPNKIEGSARLNLRNKVKRALELIYRWLRLMREPPDNVKPFHTEQAKRLRTTVRNKIDSALAELAGTTVPAAEASRQLLQRYAALFNGTDASIKRLPVGLTNLLNGDLLAHPAIVFDDAGEPSEPLDSDVLLTLVKQPKLDFKQAAEARAKDGDFVGAEEAVRFAELTGQIDDRSADLARDKIENLRDQIQSELEDKIRDTRGRLDRAYAVGTLTLEKCDQQRDRIPQGDFSASNTFEPLFTTLKEIDQVVDDAEEERSIEISRLLANLDQPSLEDEERIKSAIDSGRFQVAVDFIERIERDEGLPALEQTDDRPFDRFFPVFVEDYASLCEREGDGLVHARDLVASRDSDGLIDASELSEDKFRDGVDLLEAWKALRDGHTSIQDLSALASALGFAPVVVQPIREKTLGGERVFELRTAPIKDRGIVQLPVFGSRADGKYRLFAVRRRKTEEAIVREARGQEDGPGRPPNIVLFFGTLDADARRSLAREFRNEEYHPTIVLDESLVVFLAAWPGNRLSAFFDCVSAFYFSQPFEPDAAELAPEMFFGREEERRGILAMSHDMKHFVYGGRRLGKTTLLASIEREYRERRLEELEKLVLLINLKGSGIGENRPTEDLWPLFAEKLTEYGVVGSRMHVAEAIGKSVKQWLGEVQGRRILLLVDEADAFLESECKPKQGYRVLEQVKRLMEETDRRFKVVFAGLHNVQRAVRDRNTPFAHLGGAIRIGPMLPENDGDAMQNLIRGPLEALGCRFDSDDSVIRIAAETNYYPALAQQFCKELLKLLREESYSLRPSRMGPPYQIDWKLVDRVFKTRETRDRIRNLFSWTIHLDHRYEFLTYLIAQRSFDNEEGRPQAMSIEAVRDAALSEWPRGFAADSSFWTFEVLLEEMIGLGILREVANNEYAIRTRNLRSLLGDDDKIERRFRDAKSRKPPRSYDAAQFRSTLAGNTLSSLTAHQESRLLSGRYTVGLVFGTRLAGLHRVADSLREAAEKRDERLFVEEVAPGGTSRPFLRRALKSRKPGTHVVLLDMNGVWDSEWLGRMLAFVEKHKWQDRIIRPVFLCDPQVAWKRLSGSVPSEKGVELQEVWLAPCGRDFSSTWLKDQESPVHEDLDKPDQDTDLPWPIVVEAAAGREKPESIHKALLVALEGENPELHVGDVVGVSDTTDTALHILSTFPGEPMKPDLLSEFSAETKDYKEYTNVSPEEVIEFFKWASRLGIVCKDKDGYRLDQTYEEGLRRVFER